MPGSVNECVLSGYFMVLQDNTQWIGTELHWKQGNILNIAGIVRTENYIFIGIDISIKLIVKIGKNE